MKEKGSDRRKRYNSKIASGQGTNKICGPLAICQRETL